MNQINAETDGIVKELFKKPEKLHITISMLILIDDEDKEKAIKALEYCKEKFVR